MSAGHAQGLHMARPGRLLVIVAHPDDADFGAAATVAKWTAAGTVARMVCCTSGDAGADDASIDPFELAPIREREQRAAAEVIGYEGVDFLHRPDGALANDLALREQLVRIIRTFRPDAVMAMDPTVVIVRRGEQGSTRGFVQHVDHRAAAMAALDAVYPAARNALAFPHLVRTEGLEPHAVNTLYLFFTDAANVWVDVTDTLEAKVAALRKHASQLRRPAELEDMIRGWAAEEGARCGVAAAESFRLVELA
jgi:LmbE family N-acetylglucosaminyl deacetylase